MIDTSALMAIVLNEPQAEACMAAIEQEPELAISAATLAEALVVATRRGIGPAMDELVRDLAMETVPVTEAEARRVSAAYSRWGRGVHKAGLNFGDCFAYALAKQRQWPLLFVGNDFARTDLQSALR
ncbi:MAG TPA: type II toxin-antitoxin system VapC family toxin [Acetobacteraceae bacterium]|nr:type II toxin-antitoxin system VapC family toxin [Acetobacteraceae bacterium]